MSRSRLACAAVCVATAFAASAVVFAQGSAASGGSQAEPDEEITTDDTVKRTPEQVEALIEQAATTKPDWFDEQELKGVDKVDMTWAEEPPPGKQKFGAYLWSYIGSNPNRYKEGVRLLHHALTVNKDDRVALAKTMNALGESYYNLLADYPRAVFWWRKAMEIEPRGFRYHLLHMARCYHKMGNRRMAIQIIGRVRLDKWRHADLIRLWAEMGMTRRALAMVEPKARAGMPDSAYLAAGDIHRQLGRFDRAIVFYNKVLATTQGTHDLDYNKKRAQRNIDAIQVIDALDLKRVADGTYTGTAPSFIEETTVEVVVKQGRIESVEIAQSKDDRPLTAWTEVPATIVRKQGLKGVDTVSGATVTSDAIIYAAGNALKNGIK